MDIELAYQQALDYLYSFVDYSLQRTFHITPADFDLGRMHTLLRAIDDPQQIYPTIHIAGTKGKGSVSALCAGALQAAGYRVGLYTQPHLVEYTERIQVNRQPIPKEELVMLVEAIKPAVAEIPRLTTFEIGTALAFWYFARCEVDVAVIEVGLGGRLDATNVILPKVAVITSISYDHVEFLGDTLGKIATEKAGIVKAGVPLVMAPQEEEARQTIKRIAADRRAPLFEVGRDLLFAPLSHSLAGQELEVWLAEDHQKQHAIRLKIPLLGLHQVENAATAYAALLQLRQTGIVVSAEAIQSGFAGATWPARFEILRDVNGQVLVVDSAHNRDSARKLRRALEDYFPNQAVVLIFGASQDKDIAGILLELLPVVQQIVVTQSTHPRAAPTEMLAGLVDELGRIASPVALLEDAVEEARRIAANKAILCATGSIFLAAGVRQVWLERYSL